mmetsp:Transcript_120123/g.285399  ORF Transcript_120123/g.285399 Transcript_120123/m.285399 type:complete len:382 (+) Transcript_120123:233-1378(+)
MLTPALLGELQHISHHLGCRGILPQGRGHEVGDLLGAQKFPDSVAANHEVGIRGIGKAPLDNLWRRRNARIFEDHVPHRAGDCDLRRGHVFGRNAAILGPVIVLRDEDLAARVLDAGGLVLPGGLVVLRLMQDTSPLVKEDGPGVPDSGHPDAVHTRGKQRHRGRRPAEVDVFAQRLSASLQFFLRGTEGAGQRAPAIAQLQLRGARLLVEEVGHGLCDALRGPMALVPMAVKDAGGLPSHRQLGHQKVVLSEGGVSSALEALAVGNGDAPVDGHTGGKVHLVQLMVRAMPPAPHREGLLRGLEEPTILRQNRCDRLPVHLLQLIATEALAVQVLQELAPPPLQLFQQLRIRKLPQRVEAVVQKVRLAPQAPHPRPRRRVL